jgi:large subunit ribosomal protein L32
MAVPRNRVSNSRKNLRRAHHAKKAMSTGKCSNCGEAALPHRVCKKCGHYKGKQVFQVEANA